MLSFFLTILREFLNLCLFQSYDRLWLLLDTLLFCDIKPFKRWPYNECLPFQLEPQNNRRNSSGKNNAKWNHEPSSFVGQADLRWSLNSSKSLVTNRHPPHIRVSGMPAKQTANSTTADYRPFFDQFRKVAKKQYGGGMSRLLWHFLRKGV